MTGRVVVFVGLGASLGERAFTLDRATQTLANEVEGTRLVASSPYFRTRPMGAAVEEFLNGVLELETTLEPLRLLGELLKIERAYGRVRSGCWDDRTLDLDLLCALRDGEMILLDHDALKLPHPRLHQRDFVLVPLARLAPDLRIHGRTVATWLDDLPAAARTIVAELAPR